jgi:BON domain-containing protein
MKRILWVMVLGSVASASAQQSPPTNQPPYTTPPTFPRQQMPPDTKAPPPQRLSTAQIEQQIQDKLNSEPALANTKVSVRTNDRSVTLLGAVNTEQQHELAIRIARSYAGDRKILDKIKVQERT